MSELRPFKNMQYASKPRLVDKLLGKLRVETKDNTKRVIFHDPIYVNSPFTCPTTFTAEFTDWEVLCSQEVQSWLAGITGYRLVIKWEIP